jgi:hypothetical protein
VKVKMKMQVSGTRDGVAWPAPGEVVELPDAEGAKLCANGTASPVAEKADKVEKAVAPDDDVEKRGPGRPRKQ